MVHKQTARSAFAFTKPHVAVRLAVTRSNDRPAIGSIPPPPHPLLVTRVSSPPITTISCSSHNEHKRAEAPNRMDSLRSFAPFLRNVHRPPKNRLNELNKRPGNVGARCVPF